jgi:demethylmenaquinone methyltransferase/2-methoxy-6-polyprenyl-1,4-benzoquinol methylase
MIDFGRAKIQMKHLSDRIHMLRGDALYLPFSDGCFDVAAIAFGIRNIPNKIEAITEMVRVVVPGGQVVVLEMTLPRNGPFLKLYQIYLNRILPCLARAFSSNPEAYHYLGDSIMNFPTPNAMATLMEKAGLRRVEQYSLTLGITHLHLGVKLEVP